VDCGACLVCHCAYVLFPVESVIDVEPEVLEQFGCHDLLSACDGVSVSCTKDMATPVFGPAHAASCECHEFSFGWVSSQSVGI